MAKKSDEVFVLQAQQIICAARIKNIQQARLLTGVACLEAFREQGLTSYLLRQVLNTQSEPLYCFPYSGLECFYRRLGFQFSNQESLPEPLRQAYLKYSRGKKLSIMIYQKA